MGHFEQAMCDVGPSMARGTAEDGALSLSTDVGGYEVCYHTTGAAVAVTA